MRAEVGGLAALRRVVREIELRFGQAERARHRDQLGMLIRVADLGLMAQRLTGVDIFADLGERHRDADIGQILERAPRAAIGRSEEHTSELQSLMRISYAVFCLKKKKQIQSDNK